MARILDVYLANKYAGKLNQDEAGELSFTYDDAYVQSGGLAISLSLPVNLAHHTGIAVKAYFSGLLPDETIRERLAAYLGLSEQNTFSLLEAVGGDCAGALALYPEGQTPAEETNDIETLDHQALTEILALIEQRPMLAGEDGLRLSLAGAQRKLAVGFDGTNIQLIKGGAPTTHILKPIIDRFEDTAHNELFAMRLADMVGITAPKAQIYYVGDKPYYLVERYDRVTNGQGQVTRVHQEDFCQALAIPPDMKYEREGGPNLAQSMDLIKQRSIRPAVDALRFLDLVIFNFLIGNADAHGKNFSFLYRQGKPELAPAYDLLSTAIYPALSDKMAMKIGGKYKPREVYPRHFYKIVPNTKAAETAMQRQINTMAEKMTRQAEVLKDSLSKESAASPIFNDIQDVIVQRAKNVIE